MIRLIERFLSSKLLTLCILLAVSLHSSGCGEPPAKDSPARQKIVMATDTNLIPMAYINDQNQLTGFEPDLIKAIADHAGFDVEIISVAFPGLFGGLITGKFDLVMSSITILEERKERMAFSIPYLQSGLALVVRKDQPGIQSVEDLRDQNLTVGAQRGTTAYFYLEKYPTLKIKGYDAHGHAVTDLINGKIDGVLGESTGTLYYKNQQKDYFKKIKMVGEILTEEFYGIVFRKDEKALLAKVNAALTALLEDGTVEKLHAKWNLGDAAQVPKSNAPKAGT
ncbi:MAG: basic amino acid ABC transporter substrate-binding protein [Nitrospinae bacterium]|jgi:polar amino acid transport system substrate-binding protein|nr:basic amino acid ABC transporter substrate-binding protein [Nitrospinota bacterium]MDA1110453.1 basic amino acid ABC transporter substrate-binding protein [Nitrospinota bacterium]